MCALLCNREDDLGLYINFVPQPCSSSFDIPAVLGPSFDVVAPHSYFHTVCLLYLVLKLALVPSSFSPWFMSNHLSDARQPLYQTSSLSVLFVTPFRHCEKSDSCDRHQIFAPRRPMPIERARLYTPFGRHLPCALETVHSSLCSSRRKTAGVPR